MTDKLAGGYTGTRYLLDAVNDREYAVSYKDGKPVKPIQTFAPDKSGMGPNETIFALDDEPDFAIKNGRARCSAAVFQIETDAAGQPKRLKSLGVDYEVSIWLGEMGRPSPDGLKLRYELTPELKSDLDAAGFSKDFPVHFTTKLEEEDGERFIPQAGKLMIELEHLRNLPFPPHHRGEALLARTNTFPASVTPAASANNQPAASENNRPAASENNRPAASAACISKPDLSEGGRFAKVDAQTLSDTKKLAGGGTLKRLFDFEAQRVTEIYQNIGRTSTAAMTGHKFEDHDPEALQTASDRLTALGGKPKPLPGAKPGHLGKLAGPAK